MRIKKLKFSRGISLIELIVYIAVSAVILVAVTDLATHLVFSQVKNTKTSEVTENLNFAMQRISTDIENATVITGSYPANTLTITVSGHQLIYALDNGAIKLSTDGTTAVPITSNKVSIMVVTGNNVFNKLTNGQANSVNIQFKVAMVSDLSNFETGQTTVLLRNK